MGPDGGALVRPLDGGDERVWRSLWADYLAADASVVDPAITERTWQRLAAGRSIHGPLAIAGGHPVGLAHYVFHPSSWAHDEVCYLEDLYVVPQARRRGHAQALIAFVCGQARARGAAQVYWRTNAGNAVAIGLYDRVAARSAEIMYHVLLKGGS